MLGWMRAPAAFEFARAAFAARLGVRAVGLSVVLAGGAQADTPDAPVPAEVPAPLAPDEPPADGLVHPQLVGPLVIAWPVAQPPSLGAQEVVFDLLVDETGAVREAVPMSGAEAFVDAALPTLLGLRLLPATEAGVPVAVRVPLRVSIQPPPLSLEGTVRLAGGGAAPVAEVRVCIAAACVDTDANGRFAFHGLPEGEVEVRVTTPSLRVPSTRAVVAHGEVVVLGLWAEPERVDAGIVGVYARPGADVQRRVLDAAALREMPGTLGDPLRAVANLPGTQRSPLDTGWLLVRGADPLQTVVSIDGVRVPLVYHLGGYTSVLHPAFVESVSFLPGGGGAGFGRGLAGAVDVRTRAPAKLPEVRAGANLVFAGAFAEVPTPVGTFALAARRSYVDAVLSPFLEPTAAASLPTFWDWQARAVLPGGLRIFGMGFSDSLAVAADDGSQALLELGTQRVHVSHHAPFAGRLLSVTPFLAWEHLRFEVEDWERESRRDHYGGGVRAEWLDPGTGTVNGGGGVDLEAFQATVRSDELQRAAAVGMPDLWGELRVGTVQTLVVGLRADTLFIEGQPARLAPSPRLAVHLPVAPRATVEFEVGGHHQPPPWELLLVLPEASALELDEAWGGSVRGEWGVGAWTTTLESFGRYSPRLTGFEADGSLGQGEGLAWGVEAAAELRLAHFDALARFGVGESGRREEPEDAWYPSLYDQRFTAGLVATGRLPRLWSLSGRLRVADGYAVAGETVQAFDALSAQLETLPAPGGRTEVYASLDVKVSKRWLFRSWRLDAWLDIQNVTNHRVPERVVTGFADLPISEMAVGFVTLPIFGVEASWQGDPRRP